MIQVSEKLQQAKFVYMNYPDIAIGLLDCNKKEIIVHNGLFHQKYPLDTIDRGWILWAFGNTMGPGLIELCKSLSEGNKLTSTLVTTLVKEEERCIEDFSEE